MIYALFMSSCPFPKVLLKMKRSQKFKQSLNPLLSWIWTKISVDIKAQGTVNVKLRHLILPFPLSQKHTVVLWSSGQKKCIQMFCFQFDLSADILDSFPSIRRGWGLYFSSGFSGEQYHKVVVLNSG